MEFASTKLLLSLAIACFVCTQGINTNKCHQETILNELYRSLYRAIDENTICSSDRSITNVQLLNQGLPLLYSDFNPGKPKRFSRPGSLPSFVVENGLPLVDKIYPNGPSKFKLLTNTSASTKDYRFDSFSSMYDYVLTHMMLTPQNFSDQEVLRAKYYLQELVPNPERVLRNETQLPRYLLYDYYRSNYNHQKSSKDDAIDSNRTHLAQQSFEIWGQKKLSGLESDTEAAYQKWQVLGYKSEVEKQLQYFDIDTHEDKLMSTRALFKSMGRPSERNAHVTIYPYTLEPEDWFKHLQTT